MKPVPKDIKANIAYRRAILERAAGDEGFQNECWIRSKRDPVFFCDAFCWTFNPKQYPKNPVRPFILYDYQEVALRKMQGAIEDKHDLIFRKSRDMGASWLILLSFDHLARFFSYQTFLEISRNENAVDKRNDPDSLFWKLDFLHDHLPPWLAGMRERQSMSIMYQNKSGHVGASTTGDAGRGGRKTAADLDEFSAVERGQDYDMLKATREATYCRFINATPKGTANAYATQLEKYQKQNPDWVITFHWSQHPIKSAGAYRVAKGVVEIVDQAWHEAHPGYEFITKGPFFWEGELRSPWYDRECERAASPQEIAQELDMKMAESAYQYFDASVLARLRDKHASDPYHRGEIVWDSDFNTARWDETPNGRVLLWFHPDPSGRVPWSDLVIGCDVATGKGGDMSSNSVASAVRSTTGEKIAEFPVNTLSAFEFCEYALAMCHWMNGAYLIYEDTGPGGEFTRRLRDGALYGNVYRDDVDDRTVSRKKTKRLGFAPTPRKKQALLADYRNALATGRFINHSEEALIECGQYEVLPTGEIQHSRALAAQDPNARGKNHGDRVIADALCWLAIRDRGQAGLEAVSTPAPSLIPPNCALARRQQRQRGELANSW